MKRRKPIMKKPLAHQYLSQYLPNEETKGLINYYKALIIYRKKEIDELNEIVKNLEKVLF